jgi:hypothetical protein
MVSTSNAAKGSSNNKNFRIEIKDNAMTSFFFCPPDKNSALTSLILSNSNLEIK